MPIKKSVNRFFSVANQKADQLTAGAKAVLCIPSIIAGLPDLGKGIIGGVIANIGKTLENFASTISNIVTNTIKGAVSQITGSIVGVFDIITSTLGQIGSVIEAGKEFAQGIKDRATDVIDFTSEKENCNFAAASLLNCITAEVIGSVSLRSAVDLSKELKPVADFANDISNKISGPTGAISRTVDKAAGQVNRATKLIQKSNLF
jgi:phage-related protein